MVMKMTPGLLTAPRIRASLLTALMLGSSACGGASDAGSGPPGVGPASMAVSASPAANAEAGATSSVSPAVVVKSASGAALGGVSVSFAVTGGGGSVAAATATTDSNGEASPGAWTFGTGLGSNTLSATVSGLPVVIFSVSTRAAAPATITPVSDNATTASAGMAVTPAVRVADRFNNNAANVSVTFAPEAGTVSGATIVTDAQGIARNTWTLGTTIGTQKLNVTAGAITTALSIATTAPQTIIAKISGDNSTCAINVKSCAFLARVTNTLGTPLPGETVRWSSGAQTPTTSVTNQQGYVSSPNLVAQSTVGTFTQTATVLSTSVATSFTYRTVTLATGDFNIDVRFSGSVTTAQRAAFTSAATRWRNIIQGDVPDITITTNDSVTANVCGITHPAVAERVDDVLIFVELLALDGPGGLLGQAGPCFARQNSRLTIIGTMQFDVADVNDLLASGQLQDVITHEMGHVLGIGSLWNITGSPFLLTGATGVQGGNPFFTGTSAKDFFTRIGGTLAVDGGVPVENCVTGVPSDCGEGTVDSHWRESIFKNELMTGYIQQGSNPLSNVTIAALTDQGYFVTNAAADAYVLPTQSGNFAITAGGAGSSLAEMAQSFRIRERPSKPPRTLTHN